ncbi:hypothetical protein A3A79_02655 [Candidatus Gottesmanbacteria bacterium RIFCSPLOWO2_01_FULL_43_11b]|uniref:Uncharacterized protein n=1 Tax=Candidatus Gottesmanbacteria bacterium RIFCSPLOWO2_01_FULL_43_11b TaxID=1798392 RepID=A0A1F6AI48_9BACT|nr:MAG: hypothetical protein A3A79_02655 [Candidatus Gottesmanbacteria bacterium RIFCSPLOWO2_01_FULL_43_11b]
MSKTILQVPIDKTLRNRAAAMAVKLGFSSLQEPIRLFLHKFAASKLNITFEEPPTQLSPRAARRYEKMIQDIKSGRVKTKSFTSIDALMKDLHS